MDRGIVTGIQRTNRACTVSLLGGPTITAAYLGLPPCPRSIVAVERFGNGSWLVIGQLGDRRVILHDDFLAATTAAQGDTSWRFRGTAGAIASNAANDAQGQVQLTTNAAANQWVTLSKDASSLLMPTSDAIWISARIRVPTITSVGIHAGLSNDSTNDFSGFAGGDAQVALYFDTGGTSTWKLRTVNGGSGTDTDTAIAVTTSYFDFDIVTVGGSFASLWIGGVGPTTYTGASLIAAGAATQPAMGVYPIAAAQRFLEADWIHVERCSGIVQP